MKRALQLCSILALLGVSAFFVSKVSAAVFVQNNENGFCLGPSEGVAANCSGSTGNDFQQKIDFQFSQEFPALNISSIGLFTTGVTNAANDSIEVKLYNSVGQQLATSGVIANPTFVASSWYDIPISYSINNQTIASETPEWIYWDWNQGSAAVDFRTATSSYGFPFVGTFSTTTIGSFPNNFPGKKSGTPYQLGNMDVFDDLANHFQIAFRINSAENFLTIDTPENNEVLSEPFYVTGVCTNSVEVSVFNGLEYASSSVAFGQTVSCSGGSYSFYPGVLDTGFWNITASSSPFFVGIVVYNTGQSQLPIEDWPEEWLDEIATSSSPFDVLFRNWFGRKPYSYLSDFWAAFNGSVQNASSTQGWLTPTIEIDSDYYSMNTTFLTPDTFTTIFNQETWDSLRPVFELLIYIFFVTLWIGLFKKIV